MNKVVSIISPCYNGEKYLSIFLESVLKQTYRNIEMIFVDDGSTDKTREIAMSYKPLFEKNGMSFIYVYQENQGQAAAINQGLRIFSGEYLTWFDSDDIMFQNHIYEKVNYLKNHPDKDFVLCMGYVVHESNLNKVLRVIGRKHDDSKVDNLFKDLIEEKNVVYGPGTIMVRTSSFLRVIPSCTIYEGRQGQNLQLMLPLAYSCIWDYIDKPLFKYVIHNDSHSHKTRKYSEKIQRNEDFETLLCTTIRNIPQITGEESEYWCTEVKKNYLRKKMNCAFNVHMKDDVKKYRDELRVYRTLTYKDYYLGYKVSNFIDILKYQITKFKIALKCK